MRPPIRRDRLRAELHAHTTYSDGVLTPAELVAAAHRAGLAALAITDHDEVGGIAPAREAAAGLPLELIPGVELSSHLGSREVHLLGLFIDETAPGLRATAAASRHQRRRRAERILARLRCLGASVELEAVEAVAGPGTIGRPHIATAMVRGGVVGSTEEAFHRYLGLGRPAYVPKLTPPAAEVIEAIHGAGGVALLAHPGSSRLPDEIVVRIVGLGLDGIEVRHPKHSAGQEARLAALARRLGVLPSGGSDFHGKGPADVPLGAYAVPLRLAEALRRRAGRYAVAGQQKEAPP